MTLDNRSGFLGRITWVQWSVTWHDVMVTSSTNTGPEAPKTEGPEGHVHTYHSSSRFYFPVNRMMSSVGHAIVLIIGEVVLQFWHGWRRLAEQPVESTDVV